MAPPAKKKSKKGRPSKKDKIPKKFLEILYTSGKTDEEVAEILEVTRKTLTNWKKADPDFFNSIKDWKLKADEKVERSLYERACGYTCPETVVKYVKANKLNDAHWEKIHIRKYYPPDSTAIIFWLKNRKPTEWRDRHDVKTVISIEDIIDELEKDI